VFALHPINAPQVPPQKAQGPDKRRKVSLGWAYRIYIDGMYVEIAKCWSLA
jgi:hypothetical protein